MNTSTIVQKLWNYCNVLRDDGMSYGDYPSTSLRAGSEQIIDLLFLKMAEERSAVPHQQERPAPSRAVDPSLKQEQGICDLLARACPIRAWSFPIWVQGVLLPAQHRRAEVDRRLSLLREAEAQVDANLQRAGRLRQSVLGAAFSGRLIGDAAAMAA